MKIFIVLIFYISKAISLAASPDLQSCLSSHDSDTCREVAGELENRRIYKEALLARKRACSLNSRHCSIGLYFLAIQVSSKAGQDVTNFLIKNCSAEPIFCEAAADVLKEQKAYAESIVAARIYFRKFRKGPLTELAYKYGNKKEAFAAAMIACRENPYLCSGILRTMPDHPKREELYKIAAADCLNSDKVNYGNLNCPAVGAHFYSLGKKADAYKFWELDCRAGTDSCKYILAGFKDDATKTAEAMKFYCSKDFRPLRLLAGQPPPETPCIDRATGRMPASFQAKSEEDLTKILKEFKN